MEKGSANTTCPGLSKGHMESVVVFLEETATEQAAAAVACRALCPLYLMTIDLHYTNAAAWHAC